MNSFTIELASNASGELFPNNTLSSFTNFLPEQVNLAGQFGGFNFGNMLPINVPKYNGGEIQVF